MGYLTYLGVLLCFCLVKGQFSVEVPKGHDDWLKLNAFACAIRPRPERSIVRDAKLGEYPFVVQIYVYNTRNDLNAITRDIHGVVLEDPEAVVRTCMGTILSHRHVLTSSSCFFGLDPDIIDKVPMWVRAGDIDTNQNPDCTYDGVCGEEYKEYDVDHVQFFKGNGPADEGQNLAMITTKSDMEFSAGFISPVCLEHGHHLEKDHSGGEGFRMSGWGIKGQGGILYKILVNIFTQEENDKVYKQLPESFKANEDRDAFFAVGQTGLEEKEFDESGGPFLVEDTPEGEDRRMYLYGVFSFQAKDIESEYGPPGIYTKVRHYLPWILEIVDPQLTKK